jgi:hypothetical protein
MNRQMLNRVSAVVASIVFTGLLGGLMAQKINADSQTPGESRLALQQPNTP